jgi:hypothetical protein
VGPLFAASPLGEGGGFGWPTPSAAQPQLRPQQQLRFPDPQFAPSVDPTAAGGRGGFEAIDSVRAEGSRTRPGAPPPGFGKVSNGNRKPLNLVGRLPNREQNQYLPRGFDSRMMNEELRTTKAGQGCFGIPASGDAMVILYTEQQQDHFLSRTPPDMNPSRPFDRMPFMEPHTVPSTVASTLCGDQHVSQITGARILPRGQRQLDPCLENTLQPETRWQGNREETGHASQKLPNANVRDIHGKISKKEMHHVTLDVGSSVPVDVKDDLNCCDGGGISKLGLGHGVDVKVMAEAKKYQKSNQKSEIRFVGKDDEDDNGREHSVMIKQLTESLVIGEDVGAKGMGLQNTSLRCKVNLAFCAMLYKI